MIKRHLIPACIILGLALLAAAGSVSFLGPCVHEDGTLGACHWAGQALLGVEALIAAMAAAAIFIKDSGMRRGLFLAIALSAFLGIMIPGILIRLCSMETMRCRSLMRPAMTIINILTGILAGVGLSGK